MTAFRSIVWYIKGLREYTKAGFERASKYFGAEDLDVDLTDKIYMVTGGNSGIGENCALEIARRNGEVHLVCRNEELGKIAQQNIITETENTKIYLHILDISQPYKIIEFTKAFSKSHSKLDVLINNAGCMVNKRETTRDGLDLNFATNTLGYYLVTVGLLDPLLQSDDPRVLFVSSGGMLVQKLDSEDFNFTQMSKYDGVMAYAQNKRQQVVMCEQLAKLEPKIYFASMHPGWADTPAVKSSMPEFHEKMKDKLRTSGQGADTLIWLAISSSAKNNNSSGSFFQDRVSVSKHLPLAWTHTSNAQDEDFMAKLSKIASDIEPKLSTSSTTTTTTTTTTT